ncbi:MAG TPA: alpha/beta fold hydrolase [Candidatus Saccharimonadales bacterium]|nr:alpha/beta fold hydrolase [Candidatus Saccharimonadales bacterium]
MKLVFKDPTFSLQLLRAIGETYYRGADIGECLSTAYRIEEGNFESWHEEWLKTAKRIHGYAEECITKNHKISARDAYLRASNYYRVSAFLLVDPNDPRIRNTVESSKDCFKRAASLFPFLVEEVQIPYEGTFLPGYFYHASKSNYGDSKKESSNIDSEPEENKLFVYPTLIAHGGFDSTLEELYSSAVAPAIERGYNCLTFEGPGQGEVIRKQKIPFRYDWEKVITPVIDFALSKKSQYNIDPKRIALMGISMGGYLAARAIAFEPRISACVLYNGVYDGYDSIRSGFPPELSKAVEQGDAEFVNSYLTRLMETDPNIKFNMKHGMYTSGTNSPYELIIGAKAYSIMEIIKDIKTATLVLDAEKDDSFPGQPKRVYDGLVSVPSSSREYILFTEEEGAEEHCQCGAPAITNQRIFDWLDQILKNNP